MPLVNLGLVLLLLAAFRRELPWQRAHPPAPPPDPWGVAMEGAIHAASTGNFARGAELARAALGLAERSPTDDRRLILSLTRLGSLELRAGQVEAARATVGRLVLLETSGVLPLLSHPGSDLHEMLGELAQADGRLPVAESHYRAAIRIEERLGGPRTANLLNALLELARLLREREAWGPARAAYEQLLDLEIADPAAAAAHRSEILVHMAGLRLAQGDADGAAPLIDEALTLTGGAAPDSRTRVEALLGQTEVWMRQGRLDEAETGVRKLLEIARGRRSSPILLQPLEQLARILTLQGRLEEASVTRRELLELGGRLFGSESPLLAYQLEEMADLGARREEFDAALPMVERATRLVWRPGDPLDWRLPRLLQKQAALVNRNGCGLQSEDYQRMAERIGGRLQQRGREN